VFHISIWGGLVLCLGGAKPTKASPWRGAGPDDGFPSAFVFNILKKAL